MTRPIPQDTPDRGDVPALVSQANLGPAPVAVKLTKPQEQILRQMNGEFVPGAKIPTAATMRALSARGLIAWGYNGTGGWKLTDDGKARAEGLRKVGTR